MLLLIMLPVRPVMGKPGLSGSFQARLTVFADLLPRPVCSSSGVTYPTPTCSLTVFQWTCK